MSAPIPRSQTLRGRLLAFVLRPTARPLWLGVLVALGFIAFETLAVLGLKKVAPENAFGAVFLLGVLVVSAGWGFGLAVATSLGSALVYVYFHLEGADSLVPALFVFLPIALLANILAGQARLRAAEAEERRVEADLSAELARSTLRAGDLRAALNSAGRRIAEVLGLAFAELHLDQRPGDESRSAIQLLDGGEPLGTLLVPADLAMTVRERVQRIVPSLEALLAATRDRQKINAALEVSHAEASALAKQQTALRRVATLVARGAEPAEVYPVAVAELARGLEAEHVTLVGYEPEGECVVLAARDSRERPTMSAGERFPLDGDSICARILRTARPARVDDYRNVGGSIAERVRGLGVGSGVGAPVIVDGRVRGALIVGSVAEPMPPQTVARVSDFADLVATAILNAETRAELKASRARIVTASDQARRRFERDLHDGAQQRIVSLGMELRAYEESLPAEQQETREVIAGVVAGLTGLHAELQELSRGMHPAILSRGGLGPAIKTLARRSKVPVVVEVDVDGRLPETVEVAAYYVVAEALANTAKHAEASEVRVRATADRRQLWVSISDDGLGGAASGAGSGLIGLKDRVEAVSGQLEISSPIGAGTAIAVTIPVGGVPGV